MMDCDECKACDEDYWIDEDGNLRCACDDCPLNYMPYTTEDANDD